MPPTLKSDTDGRTIETSRNFTKQYELRDQWLEQKVVGTGTAARGSISPGNMFIGYNAAGQKLTLEDQNAIDLQNISSRKLVYAADGSLLRKGEGKSTALVGSTTATSYVEQSFSRHIGSNGHYLGEVSQRRFNSTSVPYYTDTLMQQHGAGMEQGDGSSVQKYATQAGDSLRSLAQVFYGSGDYWYLIANRNGLPSEPDASLSVGQALDIPSRATKVNQADSFKPLDLQKIIGDTTPSLPHLPPPPSNSCNALAMVVMVVITVVATVFTAGAAAVAMSGGIGALGGATAGTLAAVGGAAMGGSFGVIGMAAAAVGGFVGSVAGQLAGKAMGVVDSFSLKNAFASGLTAGATAGMGSWMGVGGTAAGTFTEIAEVGAKASLNLYGKMAMAASAAGINVAANKLAGNNNVSFQWRNVVTGAATAGVMHGVGLTNMDSAMERFAGDQTLIGGTLQGIAGAAIGYGVGKGLYNQGSWSFRDVATDAFGNALGNTAVNELAKRGSTASQGSAATDKAQKARMDKMFDNIGRKIDANLDAQQNETLVKQQERITSELGGHADTQLSSGTALLESRNDADMVRYQTARLNLADSANMSSASYAQALRSRHQTQIAKLQANTDAALGSAMARGESMYNAGLKARPQMGIDFNLDAHLAADNAMWGAGKARAAAVRETWNDVKTGVSDGIGYAWGATKGSFEFYHDAIVNWPSNFEKTLDNYHSRSSGVNSISQTGGLTLQGTIFQLDFERNLAIDSDGVFSFNQLGGGYGLDSAPGFMLNANLGIEKAVGATSIQHTAGHQLLGHINIGLGDHLNYSSTIGGLYEQNPYTIGFDNPFANTYGHDLSVGFGIGAPIPSASGLHQYSPEFSQMSVDLGLFGKTVYTGLNYLFFSEN